MAVTWLDISKDSVFGKVEVPLGVGKLVESRLENRLQQGLTAEGSTQEQLLRFDTHRKNFIVARVRLEAKNESKNLRTA